MAARRWSQGAECATAAVRFVYVILVYLLFPVLFAAVLWRGGRDRGYWHNLAERFGFGPRVDRPGIWVHAVSVGEVQAASALVRSLAERYPDVPLIVTTFTPTGADRARTLFKDVATVRYVPFDLPGSVRRFFDRTRPRLAVIFETELWPNLYHECGRRRVPLVLASARISPRSARRYRWLVALFKEALSHGIIIAAQGPGDAERFLSIGANPARTHVTGNIKFDFALPADIVPRGRRLREQYAAGRPVWIAGSTHGGEEEAVLEAHRRVLHECPDALLVLVPRHPPRFPDVAGWLEREGVRFVCRSQAARSEADTQVVLVDTLGELVDFYASADVAFVGGSLVPVGGHNLLEPAALGLPILTGPHNFNSLDIAKLLIERGAAQVVHDARELGDRVAALLKNPEERARIGSLGRASVEENRGALARLLALIDPLLQQR